jgi:hypothetical protein
VETDELEATNFTLQYCLRKNHKIVKVHTITGHSFEELMVKLKHEFPWVGDAAMKEKK